ncbi:Trm112 family protein [Salegentibacter sp. F14]
MRLKTIEKLCCPFDKNDVQLTTITQDIGENILEGFLTCEKCKRIYPIVKGIPIMNPDEYREHELEKPLLEHWEKHLKGKSVENFKLKE